MARKQRPCPGCGGLTWGELCHPCHRARNTRPCEGCGKLFYDSHARTRFCSAACYQPGSRFRACEVCGVDYKATYTEQRTCSREHGAELRRQVYGFAGNAPKTNLKNVACLVYHRNCAECGKLFIGRTSRAKTCGPECARSYRNRTSSEYVMDRYHSDPAFRDRVLSVAHARRADRLGADVGGEMRTARDLIAYLMKRDHGRCGICRKPIRATKGPRRPSIDHIVPLSKDGTHELANLQVAHYFCNLSKNNRGGGEQLLLVG